MQIYLCICVCQTFAVSYPAFLAYCFSATYIVRCSILPHRVLVQSITAKRRQRHGNESRPKAGLVLPFMFLLYSISEYKKQEKLCHLAGGDVAVGCMADDIAGDF